MTRRYAEEAKRLPKSIGEVTEYRVPLEALLAAADKLEVAAVAHADATRRGEESHIQVTGPNLGHARSEFRDLAAKACTGTEAFRGMLRTLYDFLLTHHGRRLAVKIRPWVK